MNRTYKNSINGILQKTIDQLSRKKNKLLAEQAKISSELKVIDALLKAANKNLPDSSTINNHPINVPTHQSVFTKMITVKGKNELANATGTEIFVWGLDQLEGRGTASEVAEVVSQLNIDSVKSRIDGDDISRLKQWLTVSGDYLSRTKAIKKFPRKDRKGGIVYQL